MSNSKLQTSENSEELPSSSARPATKTVADETVYNKGELLKETLRMAWPAVLESFFVTVASMIDTLMVSSMGTYAVAAVGLTNQPKLITLAVFFAIDIAISALVARRKGQKNQHNANEVLVTALSFAIVVCVILSLVAVIFAPTFMDWAGANDDTRESAVLYFRIIEGGLIFNVLSLVINAAQRGAGNTRIAMTTNIVSSLVNICFNYLLINGHFGFPAWGIKGAAIATVLGTAVAAVMSVRSLFLKSSYLNIGYVIREKIRPVGTTLKGIISLAVNFLLENVAMRIGFLTTAVLAAKLGTDTFAAHQVGMNFLSLGFSFGDGMQVTAVALIGRSLGEKLPRKAKLYGSICQQTGFVMSLCLAAIFFFFGRSLFRLFFDAPDILDMGVKICHYIMIIVLFQVSQIIFAGCLRGAGDAKFCLFASLISVTLIRTAVTVILVNGLHMGLDGIWLGILSDQLSRFIILGLRFRKGRWTQIEI